MSYKTQEKYLAGLVALTLGFAISTGGALVLINDQVRYDSSAQAVSSQGTSTIQGPTVLYPNGGESLLLGKKYAVRWNTSSRGENVVYIINESGEKCMLGKLSTSDGISGSILTDFSGNACVTGITTRKPGQYQNVSRNYKIQVETSDIVNGKKSDMSDGYFGLADVNNFSSSSATWVQGNIIFPVISTSTVTTNTATSTVLVDACDSILDSQYINNTNLTVSLKAEPNQGNLPFSTKLTATRGGNMYCYGASYRFKCDAQATSSAPQSSNQYTCRYTKTGYYRPSVEITVKDQVRTSVVTVQAKDALIQAPKVDVVTRLCLDPGKSKLTWRAVDGATGYFVYRTDGPMGQLRKIATLPKTTLEFIDADTQLVHGTVYWYKVTAMGALYESAQPEFVLLRHEDCGRVPGTPASSAVEGSNNRLTIQSPNGEQIYKVGDRVNFSARVKDLSGSSLKFEFIGNTTIPESMSLTKKVESDEETITGSITIANNIVEADYLLRVCVLNTSGQRTNTCDTSDRPIRIYKTMTQDDLDIMSITLSDETLVPSSIKLTAKTSSICGAVIELSWDPVSYAVRYRIGGALGVTNMNQTVVGKKAMVRVSVPGAPYVFHITAIDSTGRDMARSNFVRVVSSKKCANTSASVNTGVSRFDLNSDRLVDNRDVIILTNEMFVSRYNTRVDFNSDKKLDFNDLAIIRSNISDKNKLYDMTLDNKVNYRDIRYVASKAGVRNYTPFADVNADGRVNLADLKLIREYVKNSGDMVSFYDVSGNGIVSLSDVNYVKGKIQTEQNKRAYDALSDLNHDGIVDQTDLDLITNYYNLNKKPSALLPSFVASVFGGFGFLMSQIAVGFGF